MGTHAFEACAFDRSATSPNLPPKRASLACRKARGERRFARPHRHIDAAALHRRHRKRCAPLRCRGRRIPTIGIRILAHGNPRPERRGISSHPCAACVSCGGGKSPLWLAKGMRMEPEHTDQISGRGALRSGRALGPAARGAPRTVRPLDELPGGRRSPTSAPASRAALPPAHRADGSGRRDRGYPRPGTGSLARTTST